MGTGHWTEADWVVGQWRWRRLWAKASGGVLGAGSGALLFAAASSTPVVLSVWGLGLVAKTTLLAGSARRGVHGNVH